MAKKKRNEKLKSFIIWMIASVIMAIVAAIPLCMVGFSWILFVLKEVPLAGAIIVTALMAITEGLLIILAIGSED